MSEIPDDILEAARAIVQRPIADYAGHSLQHFTSPYTDKAVRVVSLAILAERERCAQIVESAYQDKTFSGVPGRIPLRSKLCDMMAYAIRNPHSLSEVKT